MQQCEKCSFESKSLLGLSRHMKQKHGIILSTPKNTCSHCKRVFTSSTSCAKHIEKKVCFPKTEETQTEIVLIVKEPPIEAVPIVEEKPPLESFPITEEHPQIESFPVMEPIEQKKKGSFGATLVKVIICSVFFLPFFIRDTHPS